jgi:iron(III) transport system substrate-binding protein
MIRKLLTGAALAVWIGAAPGALAQGAAPAGYPASYTELVEASKKEPSLLVYSVMAPFNWKPVLDGFQRKYPWIKVETLDLAAQLWDRFYTEKANNARTADMIATLGVDRWIEFNGKGEVLDYKSPEDAALPAWAKPMPGVYALSADPLINVWNKRLVPAGKRMDTMKAVLDFALEQGDKAKGKLTTFDGGVAPLFGAWFHGWSLAYRGEGDIWQITGKLAPFSRYERSGGAMLEKLLSGEYAVAYLTSAITIYPKVASGAAKSLLEWSFVMDGQPLFPRAMAVTKIAKAPASAKLLLDHILTKEGQIAFSQGGLTPVRMDIKAGEIPYPTLSEIYAAVGEKNIGVLEFSDKNAAEILKAVGRFKEVTGR